MESKSQVSKSRKSTNKYITGINKVAYVTSREVDNHIESILQTCKPQTMKSMPDATETPFPCTMCRKKFRKQSFLKRHMDKKHWRKVDNACKSLTTSDEDITANMKLDVKALNDYFDSGLVTLAKAAEIHAKGLTCDTEKRVSNPASMRSTPPLDHSVSNILTSTPRTTVKVQNWLPPSPPMSDAMSPLSSIADETESNASSIEYSPRPNSAHSSSSLNSMASYRFQRQHQLAMETEKPQVYCPPYFPFYSGHQGSQTLTTTEQFYPHPNLGPYPGGCNNLAMFSSQYVSAWRALTNKALAAMANSGHLPHFANSHQ